MSETSPESAPEADGIAEAEPFDADRAQAKIKKANDEARNLRKRLQELEPLAQEAERQREASKTAEQRASEAVSAAEQRAVAAEIRLVRLEVAIDKGLTAAQAKRLVGETREELEADADELLATFAPVVVEADPVYELPATRRSVQTLRPGASPAAMPLNGDPIEQSLRNALGIR